MKHPLPVIFSVVILFLYSNLHAGSIDSLRYQLDSAKGAERAEILVELSNALVYSNTTEALVFAKEAFEIAAGVNDDSLKYAALKAMGYANGYLGNYEISLQNMKIGLDWYERTGDSVKIAEAYSDIAWLLQHLSYNQSKIMEFNLKALDIREKIGDEKGVAYSLNNIGALYWDWDKHDIAVDYFLKAAPFFENLGLDEEVATILSNIGSYYTEKGLYTKADSFQKRSLEIHQNIGHKNGEALNLSNLARIRVLQNDYPQAIKYNLASLKIRETIGDREGQVGNHYNIAFVFFKENEFEKAKKHLLKSLEISEGIGSRSKQIQIYGLLAKVCEKTGSFQNAYHYLQKSKALNDSIFGVEKHRQLEEIRAKYDFEKKTAENELLQTENENQKLRLEQNRFVLYLLSGIAVLVIAVLFLVFIRSRERAKIRDLTLEHQLIRSQMNPHFIFNTVTAIQNYIVQHSPVEAVNYLSRFASLMRQILDNSRKEFITLEAEIQTLENYLNLQLLRFPGQFNYRINLDTELDPAIVLIPPMLVQPFVENAIEHGFKECLYPGIISIGWSLQGRSFVVTIEDNGAGMKYRNKDGMNHEPFAIRAISDRLRMIHKRKKFRFEILDKSSTDEKNSGTKVVFSIPYITQND